AKGYANCKKPAAPQADDGCECATPGCCATFCQNTHMNGLGQPFYDCVAVGVHNETQATEAARAYDQSGNIIPGHEVLDPSDSTGNSAVWAVCNSTASGCPCWVYSTTGNAGGAHGRALLAQPASPNNCTPPFNATTGVSWN